VNVVLKTNNNNEIAVSGYKNNQYVTIVEIIQPKKYIERVPGRNDEINFKMNNKK